MFTKKSGPDPKARPTTSIDRNMHDTRTEELIASKTHAVIAMGPRTLLETFLFTQIKVGKPGLVDVIMVDGDEIGVLRSYASNRGLVERTLPVTVDGLPVVEFINPNQE